MSKENTNRNEKNNSPNNAFSFATWLLKLVPSQLLGVLVSLILIVGLVLGGYWLYTAHIAKNKMAKGKKTRCEQFTIVGSIRVRKTNEAVQNEKVLLSQSAFSIDSKTDNDGRFMIQIDSIQLTSILSLELVELNLSKDIPIYRNKQKKCMYDVGILYFDLLEEETTKTEKPTKSISFCIQDLNRNLIEPQKLITEIHKNSNITYVKNSKNILQLTYSGKLRDLENGLYWYEGGTLLIRLNKEDCRIVSELSIPRSLPHGNPKLGLKEDIGNHISKLIDKHYKVISKKISSCLNILSH